MDKKLGQQPAYPMAFEEKHQDMGDGTIEIINSGFNGMSKRFYAACAAMQGLLASGTYAEKIAYNPIIGKLSFEIAEELLKQEQNDK